MLSGSVISVTSASESSGCSSAKSMSNHVHSPVRRSVPCYFCNEFLEERYLPEHVKHCGAVLEECRQKCGVYVPRRNMEGHMAFCAGSLTRRRSLHSREQQDCMWKEKVFAVLQLLRATITEGEQKRKSFDEFVSTNLNFLHSKQESLEQLRMNMMDMMQQVRDSDAVYERKFKSLRVSCDGIDKFNRITFQQISEQLQAMQSALLSRENVNDKLLDDWSHDLKELQTFVAKESVLRSTMWQEQSQRINDLKLELEMRCKDSTEMAEKYAIVSTKIDAMANELRKQSEGMTKQQEETKQLKQIIEDNVKYIEEIITRYVKSEIPIDIECSYSNTEPAPTNGRLLWRIDRYKEKMTNAKESDCVLYSPMFYSKEYGYTLRMKLFLNGKGQWKDRHIIGCLKVEKGKWDPLLDWPCILRATVILRDQENPANNVRKMVKTIGHERDDGPDKESGLYMFIPHTTLSRYTGYTKGNVIFFDIQVKDISTTVSTPTLA